MIKSPYTLALFAVSLAAITTVSAQESEANAIPDEEHLHFPVRVDGKWGVVDTDGEWVFEPEYDWAKVWDDGLVFLRKGRMSGVAHVDGTTLVPFQYRSIMPFRGEDYTAARLGEKAVIIDRAGKVVLGPGFENASSFDSERAFIVSDGRREGVVTLDCEWLIKPEMGRISRVQSNGLARVEDTKGNVGFVDREGNWAIKPDRSKYSHMGHFSSNGLAPAKADGKWGFINASGEWVIKPFDTRRYGSPAFINDADTAVVHIESKRGVIDATGNMVIPAKYDQIFGSEKSGFKVELDGKTGIVDASGNMIVPIEYDEVWPLRRDGLYRVHQGERRFVIDAAGNEVTPPEARSDFRVYGNVGRRGWTPAKQDGKWGAVNAQEEWVLEPNFPCVEYCWDDNLSPAPMMSMPRTTPLFDRDTVKNPREQEWCRVDD